MNKNQYIILDNAQIPMYLQRELQKEIFNFFQFILFNPIRTIFIDTPQLKLPQKYNAVNPLIKAILKGDIYYENGQFFGKFNKRYRKYFLEMGGKFDMVSRSYVVPANQLQPDILTAINEKQQYNTILADNVKEAIDNIKINEEILLLGNYKPIFTKMINHLQDKIESNFKTVGRVVPNLNYFQKKELVSSYNKNMKLYIKKWVETDIVKFRDEIEKLYLKGIRSEDIANIIKKQYKMSYDKAKFLANQETGLLNAQYEKIQYKKAGIRYYKWVTKHDSSVRHSHRELDGTIQSFDNPPVVDKKKNRRANPQEDFNCRCSAKPILYYDELNYVKPTNNQFTQVQYD